MEENHQREARLAMHVSRVSIAVNILLSLLKLIAGILASSGAMVSDAIHSASDVFSTLIVMIGVVIAEKAPDKQHPYGHERLECVASVILSVILFGTGLGIGMAGLQKIFLEAAGTLKIPGKPALAAAVLSIVVKEWMYWYTKKAADQIHSGALQADAWHHRSDALSSIGAFAGIAGARLGFPVLDAVASVAISILIGKVSVDIFREALEQMVDHACDDQIEDEIYKTVEEREGVLGISSLHTRMFGNRAYVDVEIEADAAMSLLDSHAIAEGVHQEIEEKFPVVKHCMVHVNPGE